MREVIEKFDFANTITKLEAAGLLFKVVERFADKTKLNLSPKSDENPDGISNHEMGYLFEVACPQVQRERSTKIPESTLRPAK